MARRRTLASAPIEGEALPEHLRGKHYPTSQREIDYWMPPAERVPVEYDEWPEWWSRAFEAERRKQAARQAWCTERGHSFCRTVLGWRQPSPQEEAAGLTTVPSSGGPYDRRNRRDG